MKCCADLENMEADVLAMSTVQPANVARRRRVSPARFLGTRDNIVLNRLLSRRTTTTTMMTLFTAGQSEGRTDGRPFQRAEEEKKEEVDKKADKK